MVAMIFSTWLMVDVPGNSGLPSSISARMQPRLHMSMPLVYLRHRRGRSSGRGGWGPSDDAMATWGYWTHCLEATRISGARYQRVAT